MVDDGRTNVWCGNATAGGLPAANVPQIVAVLFCCGRHVDVPPVVVEMAPRSSGNHGGALFGQSVLSADQKSR